MDKRPIGVMDSGVGGLTVWKEIVTLLPHESTVYIGDSKNAPYGDRDPEDIYLHAKRLIQFLLTKKVKLIVVACNVITTTCIDRLRNDFKDVPIVGTVPVVKKAAELTKKRKIGILSTNGTAKSYYQKHLIEQFASTVDVVNLGTNKLVPLVEKGEVRGEKVQKMLRDILLPFQKAKVDIIALGCTHFPFLRDEMENILTKKIMLLDSGSAVARQVKRILANNQAFTDPKLVKHTMHTTGDTQLLTSIFREAKLPPASLTYISLDS
ncbi:MAG TPA: glutamate racemase [Candidatus Eisenbacteria bacterium]|nr:glutamate racemase [Candidatus Eisenbacteria bacterium]